jgi:pimeloyl-ACP methyl ester carboxylesterase
VTVWQGTADLMVPFAHGEWLAAAVPGSHARLIPGDGHLSIVVGRAAEIVDDLLARG